MSSSKSIIVTGASSGIGHATAKALAAAGHKVLVAARRKDRLTQLVNEIGAAGGVAEPCAMDVTSRSSVEDGVDACVKLFGGVDVLVNNAGIMPLSFLAARKVDEWDRMIDTNIKGVLYGIAAVLPHMMANKSGHVITVSSVAGHVVNPSSAVYSGTKFAVRAIMEGLRRELNVSHNIRTTIISPGAVATELTHSITDQNVIEAFKKMRASMTPLVSDDIARAIVYAVEQHANLDINEMIIRPTQQAL